MAKVICTDKKLKQGQVRGKPGMCFKRGVSVGYATGITYQIKKVPASKTPPPNSVPLRSLSKDLIRELAAKAKIKNYGKLKKEEMIAQLKALDPSLTDETRYIVAERV